MRQAGSNLSAHAGRPGCGNQRHRRVINEDLAYGAVADKNLERFAGASPKRAIACSRIPCDGRAVSDVFSEGCQTTGLPQTSARAAFHDHTQPEN